MPMPNSTVFRFNDVPSWCNITPWTTPNTDVVDGLRNKLGDEVVGLIFSMLQPGWNDYDVFDDFAVYISQNLGIRWKWHEGWVPKQQVPKFS